VKQSGQRGMRCLVSTLRYVKTGMSYFSALS